MAFLDLDGLKTFLSGCDNRYAPKSHSHTQYLNMNESRTANTVLAGPDGKAGVATFRKLVANDIPSISKSKISDFPSSMPASDVYSWAKASSKPSYSFSEIGGKVNASTQLTGTVPSSCLPSYVDDVLEYNGLANFPKTGESGKIYTDTSTNKVYRWGGSSYVVISDTITLGTTSSTAYRGDLGNEAHSWASTAKAHADKHGSAFASGLYKITTNDAGHVTNATAVAKSDITALGIPSADTHYTSNLIVGTSSSAVANSATANGTTFLNLVENGGVRNSHQIKGAGATTVSADANGVITITSTDTKTTDTWRPCVDNLTSTATDQSLSANQGRILNNKFANYVPTSRTVNGKALTSNIVLTASDVSASAVGHTHSYAGSSTPGGSATSAVKLDTATAGGATTPVYFSEGKPVACTSYSNASVNYANSAGRASTANESSILKFKDTRDVNSKPSDESFTKNGITAEFKCVSTIGSPAGFGGTYCGLMSVAPWRETSGGNGYQLAFGYNEDAHPRLALRSADLSATAWGSWYKIYTSDDKPTKADVGLGNVDNTADSVKSVKYATSAGSASSATTADSATTATYIKDSLSGRNLTITYAKDGQSSTSWLASWNGTELGCISPANITAGSANKLNANAGSATQPIYFSGGKPTACTFSLGKSVPSNAVFTDTWKQLTGSTASDSGTAGYAPAPSAGANNRYLRCDGTWVVPPDTNTDTKYSAGAGLSLSGTTFSLASSGVTSGSYGPSSNVNGTNGTTISVPQITVDSYGRVTSIVNRTYTSVNTDTNTTYSAIPEETITALFN